MDDTKLHQRIYFFLAKGKSEKYIIELLDTTSSVISEVKNKYFNEGIVEKGEKK